jgi:hypothetical protein
MNETPIKKGRGRPAGGTSFVNVSIADLKRFGEIPVPVSRVWLEKMGLTTTPLAITVAEVQEKTEDAPKIEFKITTFD